MSVCLDVHPVVPRERRAPHGSPYSIDVVFVCRQFRVASGRAEQYRVHRVGCPHHPADCVVPPPLSPLHSSFTFFAAAHKPKCQTCVAFHLHLGQARMLGMFPIAAPPAVAERGPLLWLPARPWPNAGTQRGTRAPRGSWQQTHATATHQKAQPRHSVLSWRAPKVGYGGDDCSRGRGPNPATHQAPHARTCTARPRPRTRCCCRVHCRTRTARPPCGTAVGPRCRTWSTKEGV